MHAYYIDLSAPSLQVVACLRSLLHNIGKVNENREYVLFVHNTLYYFHSEPTDSLSSAWFIQTYLLSDHIIFRSIIYRLYFPIHTKDENRSHTFSVWIKPGECFNLCMKIERIIVFNLHQQFLHEIKHFFSSMQSN